MINKKQIPYSRLYEKIVLIRKFENRVLELFSEGKLFGTTHTYAGQEAIAVSAIENLKSSDIVFSSHRCHGHYLAKEDDPLGLLGEMMGKEIGVCAGRGGSQHLYRNNFFSNGIQGGYLSNALGAAFAEKYTHSNNIVVAFVGDGTFGEGIVYETLNLASLWQVPLLILVENNYYAQTTHIEQNLAGSIIDRSKAFDIQTDEITSNDVSVLYPLFNQIIRKIRKDQSPYLQVVNTYRLNAHSKGDDYRDTKEVELWRKKDPLIFFKDVLKKEEREKIESSVDKRLLVVEKEVMNANFSSFSKNR